MTIGRITVDLLAKTGSFESDINRAAKLAEKRAKQIDESIRTVGTAMGVALAGGATAAALAMQSTLTMMDDLSKAATRVGLPTEDFSKLNFAASLADVSLDTLVSTMGH